MLDLGFLPDVKRILALVPRKRQTLLFSATMPPAIEELAQRILHTPEKVFVTPAATTPSSWTSASSSCPRRKATALERAPARPA
jgi:superfamily II DNA/RNA helicase